MTLKGTLAGSYNAPITLDNGSYANPVTVTGIVSLASAGIDLQAASAWSIVNSGRVLSPASAGSYGVQLAVALGGNVDNLAGGVINSNIGIDGAHTVTNAGTITGGQTAVANFDVLSNVAGGSILASGSNAIAVTTTESLVGPGTLYNAGLISGQTRAVAQVQQVVNAASGTIVGASIGVFANEIGEKITNAGTIASPGAAAIDIFGSGSIDNRAGGQIIAAGNAIAVTGVYPLVPPSPTLTSTLQIFNAGTISNASTLDDPTLFKPAIFLLGVYPLYASITNAAGGAIFSQYQGIAGQASGSVYVFNAGTIETREASFNGVSVSNAATGIISSGASVAVYAIGTVTNAGTIAATGSNAEAVRLWVGSGAPDGRLIVDPGAVFVGAVDGGQTAAGTGTAVLELARGNGSIAGVGSQFVDFGTIAFDAGANWMVSGSKAGLAGGQTISGFAPGSTIALTGVDAGYSAFSGGVLTLSDGTQLVMAGAFGGEHFVVTPGANTDITVACFAAGTRILGIRGAVPVEELRVGDRVVTLSSRKLARVVWRGRRHADCRDSRRLVDIWPVRVCAGAFGDGLPARDLFLSPDHAVCVDGVHVPVRRLINGSTIEQKRVADVGYHHIELAAHEVMLAEGLPCESYLDTGNRAAFTPAVARPHPDWSALRAPSRR